MFRSATAALLLTLSASASAECGKIDAKFDGMDVGTALALIAEEAGFTLMNPEVAASKMSTSFEGEAPAELLGRVAWAEGFELRIRGNEVWIEKRDSEVAGI